MEMHYIETTPIYARPRGKSKSDGVEKKTPQHLAWSESRVDAKYRLNRK